MKVVFECANGHKQEISFEQDYFNISMCEDFGHMMVSMMNEKETEDDRMLGIKRGCGLCKAEGKDGVTVAYKVVGGGA